MSATDLDDKMKCFVVCVQFTFRVFNAPPGQLFQRDEVWTNVFDDLPSRVYELKQTRLMFYAENIK